MYTILLKFIKDKVFSSSGIFILMFVSIIMVFLFSNTDTILSKFGFETKTTLKGELVQAKADLRLLKTYNEDLTTQINSLENNQKLTVEILEGYFEKKEQTKETVDEVIANRDKVEKDNRLTLKTATVITESTITMPKANYERASKSNIEALHHAFSLLN